MQGSIPAETATEVNYAIALFCRDLLSVADRGRTLRIIRIAFVYAPLLLSCQGAPVLCDERLCPLL
jgi:hypothetical protein